MVHALASRLRCECVEEAPAMTKQHRDEFDTKIVISIKQKVKVRVQAMSVRRRLLSKRRQRREERKKPQKINNFYQVFRRIFVV